MSFLSLNKDVQKNRCTGRISQGGMLQLALYQCKKWYGKSFTASRRSMQTRTCAICVDPLSPLRLDSRCHWGPETTSCELLSWNNWMLVRLLTVSSVVTTASWELSCFFWNEEFYFQPLLELDLLLGRSHAIRSSMGLRWFPPLVYGERGLKLPKWVLQMLALNKIVQLAAAE